MSDTETEPESSEDPEVPEEAGAPEDEDEARRKFREALDRKRARETSGTGGRSGNGAGKVHGAHGPAGCRRSFRRRGGG
jgi:hypothetical protein